jgi:signal transduction histidine kinase
VRIGLPGVLRLARHHPAAVDAALAVVSGVLAIAAADVVFDDIARFDPSFQAPSGTAIAVAMLSVTLPLAVRRRLPLLAALVIAAALVLGRQVLDVYEQAMSVLALYLSLYSAARYGTGRWRVPALACATGLVTFEIVDEVFLSNSGRAVEANAFFFFYNVVILALPWWLGSTMRTRQRREQQLLAQAGELQREREENARRAVFQERVRIARELHDVVAHHVSVMGIQAGAARRVLERRPASAESALVAIETASRQAVVEMDRLLGFLRQEGDLDATAPQPGLADLPDLVADLGRAGLTVDLDMSPAIGPIPRTVELSAFRVIQEALTNALKHSGGTRATVRVRLEDNGLEVDVEDDGGGSGAPARTESGGGHGLIGMRERVSIHGGHLRTGPRPAGGFGVHAHFPLEARR